MGMLQTMTRGVLALIAGVLWQAADAVEIIEVTCPNAVPLETSRQWRQSTGRSERSLDLVVRLRHGEDGIEPIAWAFSPTMPGQQFLARIQGGPDQVTASIELYPAKHVGRPGGPMLLTGTVDLALTIDGEAGRYEAQVQPGRFDRTLTLARLGVFPKPGRDYRQHRSDGAALAELTAGTTSGAISVRRFQGQTRIADPAPVGSHPRLLFTADELPRIRAFIETPLGQRMLTWLEESLALAETNGFAFRDAGEHSMQSMWAAGHGFLYQLTGDTSHAQRAADLTWNGMTAALPNKNQWRQSYRILGAAMAYDLCYDAWTPAERANVYHFLLRQAVLFAQRDDMSDPLAVGTRYWYQGETRPRGRSLDNINFHQFAAAAAIGALAIRGDPPPVVVPASVDSIIDVAPADDYEPEIGVPVVEFTSPEMFDEWLINGPFHAQDREPLADVGGFTIRPQPGQRVTSAGIEVDWRIYHPSQGYSQGRGAVMYPRNCMKFLTSSTGMGYWPGRQIAAKLNAQVAGPEGKRRAALAATWYTVWDNDEERLIQAEPNWHFASSGVRMWINGQEVTDGDVVRVQPGLYPVMVWIPIRGGYTVQGPHLREVSFAELEAETERQQAALAAIKPGAGPEEDLVAWLSEALLEQVRRHAELVVDQRGWGFQYLVEHALPMALAARHTTGIDWLSGTGFDDLPPLLALTTPYMNNRHSGFAMGQLADRGDATQRGLARWFIETYGHGARRPTDIIATMAVMDPTITPVSPAEAGMTTAWQSDTAGVTVFADALERQGDGDLLVAVNAGGTPGHSPGAAYGDALQVGMWTKDGQGRSRNQSRPLLFGMAGWTHALDSHASVPRIAGFHPGSFAEVDHHEVFADGNGGSISMLVDRWLPSTTADNGNVSVSDTPREGAWVRRSVLVDTADSVGAAGIVIVADQWHGFKVTEAKWQNWYGRTNTSHSYHGEDSKRYAIRFMKDQNQIRIRDPEALARNRRGNLAGHHFLVGTVITESPVEYKLHFIGSAPADGALRILVDPVSDGGRRDRPQDDELAATPDGFDDLGDLGDELDEIVSGDADANDYLNNHHTLITVWTLQASNPPAVTSRKRGETWEITVGDASYLFDGERVTRSGN